MPPNIASPPRRTLPDFDLGLDFVLDFVLVLDLDFLRREAGMAFLMAVDALLVSLEAKEAAGLATTATVVRAAGTSSCPS